GLTLTGTWTFTEAEYDITYRWATPSPAGLAVPTDGAKYKAGAKVKVAEAPDASQITTNAEGKKGTWHFAGWKDAAGKEVTGTIAMPEG
ncbi:SHIRT domain-containing protein, partial [Peptoniphilaceae bacterium SGI.137]